MEPVIILVMALLVPIIYLITSATRRVKERELLHKERLRALEMGVENLPAGLLETEEQRRPAKEPNSRGVAVHGVIWAGIGAGLLGSTALARSQVADEGLQNFALFLQIWAVPALTVGLGLIIYAVLTRNGKGKEAKAGTGGPAGPGA